MQTSIGDGRDKENTHISVTAAGSSSSSSSVFVDEDLIKFEILSRLPVKSLIRLKCVSKTWLSLIEDDPYFIDLHLARSRARPSLLLVILRRERDPNNPQRTLIITANLSSDGSKAEVYKTRRIKSCHCDEILGPVHGLICFVDKLNSAVYVHNLSSKENKPVVRSTLVLQQSGHSVFNTYGFGFDPTTKQYKVLCVCHRLIGQPGQLLIDDRYTFCEVFTLGDDAWRRIDEVPPRDITDFISTSVYVNGSIYYYTAKFITGSWDKNDAVLVAFDVGAEKFRMIIIPDLILNSPHDDYFNQHVDLLEVNGHVAIACRMSAQVAKLWVYKGDSEYDSFGNREENWTEYSITLPLSWVGKYIQGYYTGGGMHQIILQLENASTVYSYDLKKKTFTKIEVSGVPSSVRNGYKKLSSYAVSLWPIEKKIRSSGEAPQLDIDQVNRRLSESLTLG